MENNTNYLFRNVIVDSIVKKIMWISSFCIILLLNFACEESPFEEDRDFNPLFVVEGRIETNSYANVIITRNVPYYFELDSADMLKLIIRQARVEVSDGENSEVLTLRLDENRFPPYFYQGRFIKGEAGKTYRLNIKYGEFELNAYTTIPELPIVDSAWFEAAKEQPGYGNINVSLYNKPDDEVFYRFYTRSYSGTRGFSPCLLANFDARFFPEEKITLSLNKGPDSFMKMRDAEFLYNEKDTVILKVCRIDREQYKFWESYHEETFGSSNPFTAASRQVRSNIEGGIGNWGGFAVSTYLVYPDESKLVD